MVELVNQNEILLTMMAVDLNIANTLEKINKRLDTMQKKTMKVAKQWKGFKPIFLTAGFALQQVGFAAKNLLQPALEASGVFEIWGAMLTVTFLPVAIQVQGVLTGIWAVLNKIPKPIKEVAGELILLGAVIGLAGSGLSFFLAGAGTLVAPLVSAATAIGLSSSTLAMFGLTVGDVIIVIAVIIALLGLLYTAFQNNWFGIKDLVKLVTDLILDYIRTFATIFKKIWEGNWDEALIIFVKAWEKLPGRIFGIIMKVAEVLANAAVSIGTKAYEIGKGIVEWLVKGITSIGSLIAKTFWGFIPEPVKNFVGEIGKGIGNVVGAIGGMFGHGGFIGGDKDYLTSSGLLYEAKGSGGSNFSPNITVNAKVSNDMDIRELANKLSQYMLDDYRRLTMR